MQTKNLTILFFAKSNSTLCHISKKLNRNSPIFLASYHNLLLKYGDLERKLLDIWQICGHFFHGA
jgi:hypothetical protein